MKLVADIFKLFIFQTILGVIEVTLSLWLSLIVGVTFILGGAENLFFVTFFIFANQLNIIMIFLNTVIAAVLMYENARYKKKPYKHVFSHAILTTVFSFPGLFLMSIAAALLARLLPQDVIEMRHFSLVVPLLFLFSFYIYRWISLKKIFTEKNSQSVETEVVSAKDNVSFLLTQLFAGFISVGIALAVFMLGRLTLLPSPDVIFSSILNTFLFLPIMSLFTLIIQKKHALTKKQLYKVNVFSIVSTLLPVIVLPVLGLTMISNVKLRLLIISFSQLSVYWFLVMKIYTNAKRRRIFLAIVAFLMIVAGTAIYLL